MKYKSKNESTAKALQKLHLIQAFVFLGSYAVLIIASFVWMPFPNLGEYTPILAIFIPLLPAVLLGLISSRFAFRYFLKKTYDPVEFMERTKNIGLITSAFADKLMNKYGFAGQSRKDFEERYLEKISFNNMFVLTHDSLFVNGQPYSWDSIKHYRMRSIGSEFTPVEIHFSLTFKNKKTLVFTIPAMDFIELDFQLDRYMYNYKKYNSRD